MVGIGPEWVQMREKGVSGNSAAAEAALDFMYWPAKRHRFGWYMEPAYEYDLAAATSSRLDSAAGF